METNPKNRKIWANAMRKSFFEKVLSGFGYRATSAHNQYSWYQFRESTHVHIEDLSDKNAKILALRSRKIPKILRKKHFRKKNFFFLDGKNNANSSFPA